MTQQHPITPPPELVQQWIREKDGLELVVTRAAQWGADQELEACCEWLEQQRQRSVHTPDLPVTLRAVRRPSPKPPSLKEQALTALERYMTGETILTKDSLDTIRRALEQLDD